MHDGIISITGKGTIRMLLLHPSIKAIMHEQIHHHRADHRALRHPSAARDERPIRFDKGHFQPSLDVQLRPSFLDVLAHRSQ